MNNLTRIAQIRTILLTIDKTQVVPIVELKRELQALYMSNRRIKNNLKLQLKNYPQHVIMDRTNLPLILQTRGLKHVYTRLNGVWFTEFKVVDQQILTINMDHKHLNNVRLRPLSALEFNTLSQQDSKRQHYF